MVVDLDVYRVARALVRAHGDEAPARGARYAGVALAGGDVDGWVDWCEITAAIDGLLARRPPMPARRRALPTSVRHAPRR
ncbi:MAG: hypothetical protein ACFCUO_09055 [Rhodospirillales bacterium]